MTVEVFEMFLIIGASTAWGVLIGGVMGEKLSRIDRCEAKIERIEAALIKRNMIPETDDAEPIRFL